MKIKLTFLGTGTSVGVPMIGCKCRTCVSDDPRDKRFRSSVLLEWEGATVVIDTTPDFRMQMLRVDASDLDAVLYTHNHADHIHGLDDIRPICFIHKKHIDLYGEPHSMDYIEEHYDYIWNAPQKGGGLPQVEIHRVTEAFTIKRVEFVPVPLMHGKVPIYGYRFGDCAYLTDVSCVPEESMPLLNGIKSLIIGAARYNPHPTHFNVEQAIRQAQIIGAERSYLTHMCHDIHHATLSSECPDGIEPACDGLTIEVHA